VGNLGLRQSAGTQQPRRGLPALLQLRACEACRLPYRRATSRSVCSPSC
jgi:hypothetical protein